MQNIGADNAGDAFYRYKMPKLVAKVEGRGNGIKTNIVNNVDIARALDRPPTYTLKHFGCELGAQTNFDVKTGTSIVNGAHDAKKLSEVLEIFIKKYVQCYNCGNPETVVKVKKGLITLKCKACGNTSDVDMRDKLTTFIVKNPPDNKLSKQEEKVKRAEKERVKAAEKEAKKAEKLEAKEKAKKKERKDSKTTDKKGSSKNLTEGEDSGEEPADDADVTGDDDEDEDAEWQTDMSEAAVAARLRAQLTAAAAALVQGGDVATGDKESQEPAAIDTPARSASPGSAAPEEVASEEGGEGEMEPAERVRKYLESKPPLALADMLAGLEVEGNTVGRMKLFYEVLLGGAEGRLLERMQEKDKYILALARDPTQQASQLIALEHYLTQVQPERMGEMPFILKMLYEEDLIDENIIIAWGGAPNVAKKHGVDKASAQQIREVSQKVLDWLEEDSDEEEDE